MSEHSSLRCSACATHWPCDFKTYDPCVECGGAVWHSSRTSIPDDEALSRKNHADFERWLDVNGRRGVLDELERIPVAGEQAA